VVFNTVTTLLFLIGESMSCLVSKARDNETGTMKQCDDVVISNATLMTWVVVFAGVQLFIFPFMKSNYTMGNLLRFDYEFREQAQITFASVALGMAIFLFASSQDGGYSDSGVSSRSARDALAWSKCARLNILCHISSFNAPFPACKIAIYAFILSAIVFHERKSNTTTTSSILTKQVEEEVADEAVGGVRGVVERQLRAICSGVKELGSEWATKMREKEWEREYEKKPRAIEVEGTEEVPPPPEGPAPTWNNNVFTNGGRGAPTEAEMRSNTMWRGGGGQMNMPVSGEFKANCASFSEYLRGYVRARVCKRSQREPRCAHDDKLMLDELNMREETHSRLAPLISAIARRSFTHTHARFARRCVLDRESRLRRLSEAC